MREAGFTGAYSVEIFSRGVPGALWEADLEQVIRDSRAGLDRAWGEVPDERASRMSSRAVLAGKMALALLLGVSLPGRSAPPPEQTVQVSVDWEVTKGQITPLLFGSNDWAVIQNPASTLEDARFARSMAQTGITFVRLHNGGLSDAWTDHATKTWDAAKIKRVYDAPYLQGKTILQNIPTWAPWMKDHGRPAGPLGVRRLRRVLRGPCADRQRTAAPPCEVLGAVQRAGHQLL